MLDMILSVIVLILRPLLYVLARAREGWPRTRAALEAAGVAVSPRHYYYPFVSRRDLMRPLDEERILPGLRLDPAAQRAFFDGLRGLDEFSALLDADPASRPRFLDGAQSYGPGDAELYYAILRTLKPRRIVEIGSGVSTLVAAAALDRNAAEGSAGRMTCIEPYEQPWLESTGVEVIRSRVERCDPSILLSLAAGDVLFIDSSHVIRPQGDVVFEFLSILPALAPGVVVHVHDVFTPYDYPAHWILERGLLWNEQYILEALLSMSDGYEILFATFWMARRDPAVAAALPWLRRHPDAVPGSFWIRRG